MRVVSLLPAATEIVAFLGQQDSLVGVSHECDWPPNLPPDLPRLTEARIDDSESSREIDDAVREVLEQGLSVYEIDVGLLADLDPDVVITQDQCSVCAVDLPQVEAALDEAVGGDAEVVSLQPDTLGDVLENITEVAEALECSSEGLVRRRKLAQKLDRATSAVPSNPVEAGPPEVCFIEWLDPLMVAGHWMPELIERAGGSYRFADAGDPSPTVEFDAIREADPDVIVIAPCGMAAEEYRDELPELTGREGWENITAVGRARVHPLDGNQYFNRPGPRLLDSLGILVRLFWPGEQHPDETAEEIFMGGA